MVKERVAYVPRSATVAWGPSHETAGMVACGTVAGAISDSFDASASLDIFSMDLGSKSGQMDLLGSVQLTERFHRLAWGTCGIDKGHLPYGMLAGGMVDGTIKVFDPAKITRYARRAPLRRPAFAATARAVTRRCCWHTPHTSAPRCDPVLLAPHVARSLARAELAAEIRSWRRCRSTRVVRVRSSSIRVCRTCWRRARAIPRSSSRT